METEILCCPFCGNIKLEIDQHQTSQWDTILYTAVVKCDKCGMTGPTASCKVYDSKWDGYEHIKQKAIELWNDRV